eukprot:scaffold207169_cov20-Tisochrysis_lutea.AAC.2
MRTCCYLPFPAQKLPIPCTIVTGALGTGKTTCIQDLIRNKPHTERWAIIVNEFGAVGVHVLNLGGVLRGQAKSKKARLFGLTTKKTSTCFVLVKKLGQMIICEFCTPLKPRRGPAQRKCGG